MRIWDHWYDEKQTDRNLQTFLVTKIRRLPSLVKGMMRLVSHFHFTSGFLKTSTICAQVAKVIHDEVWPRPSRTRFSTCVTSELASPISPWIMRTGSVKMSRASRSMRFRKVALNRRVCRSGRTWFAIDRTCEAAARVMQWFADQ